MNNLLFRKNHFDGSGDITWVANHCCGRVRHNAGVILILKARCVMDLPLTGLSVIRILNHGIAMWKNLRASPGNRDGLAELPDSECMPGFEISCIEHYFKENIQKNYPDRHLDTGALCAHSLIPRQFTLSKGGTNVRIRRNVTGVVVYGAYFSSNASTIPWAMKTKKLTIRPHAVVHSVIYDEKKIGQRCKDH